MQFFAFINVIHYSFVQQACSKQQLKKWLSYNYFQNKMRIWMNTAQMSSARDIISMRMNILQCIRMSWEEVICKWKDSERMLRISKWNNFGFLFKPCNLTFNGFAAELNGCRYKTQDSRVEQQSIILELCACACLVHKWDFCFIVDLHVFAGIFAFFFQV